MPVAPTGLLAREIIAGRNWRTLIALVRLAVFTLAQAASILVPGVFAGAAARHLWMADAVGLTTMAVMTRATPGHAGQDLTACRGTLSLCLALLTAMLARLSPGLWPDQAELLHEVSALGRIGAFGGFAVIYGPAMLRQRTRD